MLKFDGDKWTPFKKKVSYLAPYSFYTDEDAVATDDTWERVEITTLKMDPAQQRRLAQVEHFADAGADEIRAYVVEGRLPEENPQLRGYIKDQERQDKRTLDAILSVIDIEKATPAQLQVLTPLVPPWDPSRDYDSVGELLTWEGVLYFIVQPHQSQPHYPPGPGTEALYAKLLTSPTGEILDWEQPESNNGYKEGDKVRHIGKIWVSTHKGLNVWEPGATGVDDRIWKEVTDGH